MLGNDGAKFMAKKYPASNDRQGGRECQVGYVQKGGGGSVPWNMVDPLVQVIEIPGN